MKILLAVLLSCVLCEIVAGQVSTPATADPTIDEIIRQEKELVGSFVAYTPIAETYLQELQTHDGVVTPHRDHYFLSQAKLGPRVDELAFKGVRKGSSVGHFAKSAVSIKLEYLPEGFAQMAHPNMEDFDRDHYSFVKTGSESLGDWNCEVFKVSPVGRYSKQLGMFDGQIWVEDKSHTIVRYKGFFIGGNDAKGHYFHFDSYRTEVKPGLWLPSGIYAEETNFAYNKIASIPLDRVSFRAQTLFWGYGPVLVDAVLPSQSVVNQPSRSRQHNLSNNLAPTSTAGQEWSEGEVEHTLSSRLEQVGLLAAPSELDRVLDVIMQNVETANHVHFQPEAHCRELLTSRLEFFTLGHTIVISRGLFDVASDKAILAAIIALGLARIELTTPEYLHAYRGKVDPQDVLAKMNFASPAKLRKKIQELATDYIALSPYKNSMPLIHEFFTELAKSSHHIPELVAANLGDNLLPETVYSWSGTQSESGNIQRRALPLGIKTRIDPWTDRIELIESPTRDPVADKNAAFEVTPLFPPPKPKP
jgi:hypothetical protein